jgi:hypothetical protein
MKTVALSIPENLKEPKKQLLTKSNANPTLLCWLYHERETMEWWLLHLVCLTHCSTLFKFQLINSKHKLLKFKIVMNNSQNSR